MYCSNLLKLAQMDVVSWSVLLCYYVDTVVAVAAVAAVAVVVGAVADRYSGKVVPVVRWRKTVLVDDRIVENGIPHKFDCLSLLAQTEHKALLYPHFDR